MSELAALRRLICMQDGLIVNRETDLAAAWKNEAYRVYFDQEMFGRHMDTMIKDFETTCKTKMNKLDSKIGHMKMLLGKKRPVVKTISTDTIGLIETRISFTVTEKPEIKNSKTNTDELGSETRSVYTETTEKTARAPTLFEKRSPNQIGEMIVELKTLEREAKRLLINV